MEDIIRQLDTLTLVDTKTLKVTDAEKVKLLEQENKQLKWYIQLLRQSYQTPARYTRDSSLPVF
tara:strand:+ start:1189 stop:1380 length:192 start_codon:yes stop_codon:yes gene_type:complete